MLRLHSYAYERPRSLEQALRSAAEAPEHRCCQRRGAFSLLCFTLYAK